MQRTCYDLADQNDQKLYGSYLARLTVGSKRYHGRQICITSVNNLEKPNEDRHMASHVKQKEMRNKCGEDVWGLISNDCPLMRMLAEKPGIRNTMSLYSLNSSEFVCSVGWEIIPFCTCTGLPSTLRLCCILAKPFAEPDVVR